MVIAKMLEMKMGAVEVTQVMTVPMERVEVLVEELVVMEVTTVIATALEAMMMVVVSVVLKVERKMVAGGVTGT